MLMNGAIVFTHPVSGLQDSGGAAITEPVSKKEVIPTASIRRLRVVVFTDPQNPTTLQGLGLFAELPGSAPSTGGGTGPDLLLLARLDNPADATIHNFYDHVEEITTKLLSGNREEVEFRDNFT